MRIFSNADPRIPCFLQSTFKGSTLMGSPWRWPDRTGQSAGDTSVTSASMTPFPSSSILATLSVAVPDATLPPVYIACARIYSLCSAPLTHSLLLSLPRSLGYLWRTHPHPDSAQHYRVHQRRSYRTYTSCYETSHRRSSVLPVSEATIHLVSLGH